MNGEFCPTTISGSADDLRSSGLLPCVIRYPKIHPVGGRSLLMNLQGNTSFQRSLSTSQFLLPHQSSTFLLTSDILQNHPALRMTPHSLYSPVSTQQRCWCTSCY